LASSHLQLLTICLFQRRIEIVQCDLNYLTSVPPVLLRSGRNFWRALTFTPCGIELYRQLKFRDGVVELAGFVKDISQIEMDLG